MANWLEGKVVENRRLNEYLTSLIIEVDLGGYEAGQFVRIGVRDGDDVIARPYSLVNTPEENYLEVYFNIVEEGPLSPRLFALQAGDEVLVSTLSACAAANAAEHLGAQPVFVDIETDATECPHRFTIDTVVIGGRFRHQSRTSSSH